MQRRVRHTAPLLATTIMACSSSTPDAPASAPAHEHAHGHDHHAAHGDGTKGMHHRFDDAEKWAKRFDAPERDAWQKPREVVTAATIAPGATVADIGAGTGYFLPYLAEAVGEGGRVLALDVEPNLVAHMEERVADAGLTTVSVAQIPYDDPKLEAASVDRVLIVDTWHHIDARVAYTQKLAAALKPGGQVVVVDFTMDSPEGPPREHRLAPEKVIEELTAGGLEARVVEETLPRQYIVIGQKAP